MTPPPQDPWTLVAALLRASPDPPTVAAAVRLIALLVSSVEASQDPYLQRALADAMRMGADRLRI